MNSDGEDFTYDTFEGNKFIVVIQNVADSDKDSYPIVNELVKQLDGKLTPMIFTSDITNIEELRHEQQLAIPYYSADATVLKAMIRSNPGFILLQDGTVRGKWHYNDMPSADEVLESLE